jgi:hypothetical protein
VQAVKPCACGCGQQVRALDARGRARRFRRGHNLRVDHPLHRPGVENWWQGRRHSDEARAKIAEKASRPKPWLRGERNGMHGRTGASNPNYKDGSSPERQRLYASGENKELIRWVLKRDGYRCTNCGEPKRGPKSLHVHHIHAWGDCAHLRFEASNLTTLCRSCHHDAHRKEVVT